MVLSTQEIRMKKLISSYMNDQKGCLTNSEEEQYVYAHEASRKSYSSVKHLFSKVKHANDEPPGSIRRDRVSI